MVKRVRTLLENSIDLLGPIKNDGSTALAIGLLGLPKLNRSIKNFNFLDTMVNIKDFKIVTMNIILMPFV